MIIIMNVWCVNVENENPRCSSLLMESCEPRFTSVAAIASLHSQLMFKLSMSVIPTLYYITDDFL